MTAEERKTYLWSMGDTSNSFNYKDLPPIRKAHLMACLQESPWLKRESRLRMKFYSALSWGPTEEAPRDQVEALLRTACAAAGASWPEATIFIEGILTKMAHLNIAVPATA